MLLSRHKKIVAAILAAVIAGILVATYIATRPIFGDGDVDVVCREAVVLGKNSPLVTTVSLTFSHDLSRYAYTIERGAKSLVVVDTVEGPEYDKAGCWEVKPAQSTAPPGRAAPSALPDFSVGITFSPDGKRVAYIAKRGDKELMVIDGVAGPEYDEVGRAQGGGGTGGYQYTRLEPAFSNDGRHVAYRAGRGGKWFIVADGVESAAYDYIEGYDPTYSGDGLHLAYAARRGGKWFAVVDGIEGKEYDELLSRGLRFSSDGKHLSYAARLGDKWFAVRDGVEGKAYDYVKWVSPYFTYSPDGRHLVYNARRQGKCFFVVDDTEERGYDNVYGPLFGPEGTLLAYGAKGGNDQFVVTNGVEGKHYEDIDSLNSNANGTRTAYAALLGGQWRVVVDGVEGPPCDYIERGPVFSPDGNHVTYVACRIFGTLARYSRFVNNLLKRQLLNFGQGPKWFVVVDGVKSRAYDSIQGPTVTPDGRHLAYMARRGGKSFIVVDGIEHPYPGRAGSFDKGDVRFRIERGGEIIRVEAAIVDRKKH